MKYVMQVIERVKKEELLLPTVMSVKRNCVPGVLIITKLRSCPDIITK